MAEVSTIPAYILANEHLLFWMLNNPLNEPLQRGNRNLLKTFAYLDFHRWNPTRPDHVFRHRWERFTQNYLEQDSPENIGKKIHNLPGGGNHCSVVIASLKCLSDEYLTYRNGELHVHLNSFGWWQNMLSRVSALPIQAYAKHQLAREYEVTRFDENINLTLYPHDEGVENYVERHGINDSHLHINLCAYAEECWLYALSNAEEEWKLQAEQFYGSSESEELYREIHVDLTPELMYQHMLTAKRLRGVLVNYANSDGEQNPFLMKLTQCSCIAPIDWTQEHIDEDLGTPTPSIVSGTSSFFEAFCEIDWMQKLISKHALHPDLLIERAFHMYLLLMNEFMMLCVQRDNCYGFKQFQKYSNVSMSLVASATYYERTFLRMHGKSHHSQAHYVELRIAPKPTEEGTLYRISSILKGYLNYILTISKNIQAAPLHSADDLQQILTHLDIALDSLPLTLRVIRPVIVLHLIKRPWNPNADKEQCRYGEARQNYEVCLNCVRGLLDKYKNLSKWVRGIDAAADEMDTPADILAPAYRYARRKLHIPHATYHAGEDFYHLVSGIRAVCEAVDMLDMRSGDRIGHATALGVDPVLWMKTMPTRVTPTQGEWLQDLLFAWNLLQDGPCENNLTQRLNRDIREYGYNIFKKPHLSPYILRRLFSLLKLDLRILSRMYDESANYLSEKNHNPTVREIIEHMRDVPPPIHPEEHELQQVYQTVYQESNEIIELLIKWHKDKKTWDSSERRIEVDSDYFSVNDLIFLQQQGMKHLVEHGIVIETLPTSNLRISQYKEIGQHHSLRWLGPAAVKGDYTLQIVLGTDDPGVFATDIKAEFYHLFASLCKRGLNREEALEKLIRVNESGNRYAFRSLVTNIIE